MNQHNLSKIYDLLLCINFENTKAQTIIRYIEQHLATMRKKSMMAYMGHAPEFIIVKYPPFLRLCTIAYLLPYIKECYESKFIPEFIIIETLRDITLRQTLYDQKNKQLGLTIDDVIWFRHLYHANIFKIKSMQFQLFNMIYLDEETIGVPFMHYHSEIKKKLPADSPVINVHIQQNADLSGNHIQESFEQAENFFVTYFPKHQYKAFLCCSWLLYPDLQTLLPDKSNIKKFASMFEIIGVHKDKSCLSDIYGRKYSNTNDYPQITTLQKNVLHHFNKLGIAYGIRFRT